MVTIGGKLRQRRLLLKLDLPQVAARTKISVAVLEAIEGDRWDRIPGKFFAKSFVRQYASALGVKEAEIEAELDSLFPKDDVKPFYESELSREKIRLAPIVTESRKPGKNGRRVLVSFLAFVAVVVLCSVIYALWQNARRPSIAPPPLSRKIVEPVQPPAPKAEETPPALPASPEAPPPQAAPAMPAAAPQGKLVVSLAATEKTWLSVSVDGKRVFEGVMEPGQSRAFGGEASTVLHLGNAGGLEMRVNGKPAGPLGRSGQVRTIDITPEGWKPRGG